MGTRFSEAHFDAFQATWSYRGGRATERRRVFLRYKCRVLGYFVTFL
jgi:hypothetical protein